MGFSGAFTSIQVLLARFYAGGSFGKILAVHVDPRVLDENEKVDPTKLTTVGRLGGPFYANAEMPSVGEININGAGSDSSTYTRQTLSFDTHRQAGVASCINIRIKTDRVNTGRIYV